MLLPFSCVLKDHASVLLLRSYRTHFFHLPFLVQKERLCLLSGIVGGGIVLFKVGGQV